MFFSYIFASSSYVHDPYSFAYTSTPQTIATPENLTTEGDQSNEAIHRESIFDIIIIAQLSDAIKNAESQEKEINRLLSQMQEVHTENQNLKTLQEQQNKNFNSQQESQNHIIEQKDHEIEELKKALQGLKEAQQASQEEQKNRNEVEFLKNEIEQLKTKLKKISQQKNTNTIVKNLKVQISSLEKQIARLNEQLKGLKKENTNNVQTICARNATIKSQAKEIESFKSEKNLHNTDNEVSETISVEQTIALLMDLFRSDASLQETCLFAAGITIKTIQKLSQKRKEEIANDFLQAAYQGENLNSYDRLDSLKTILVETKIFDKQSIKNATIQNFLYPVCNFHKALANYYDQLMDEN